VVHKHQRQVPLKGFPYVLIYGVWHNELVIYRVFHTSSTRKRSSRAQSDLRFRDTGSPTAPSRSRAGQRERGDGRPCCGFEYV